MRFATRNVRRPARRGATQRGAAVLMALFVATLATVIVTTLFWNQFVLLRTIENQQVVAQSRLLLRGALDWARAILREDARTTAYDALSEPWAQGLEDTRLDQLGETAALASQASIAGSIEDAQARYNLRNLVKEGALDPRERDALRRLMTVLSLPEALADLIAVRMAEALAPPPAPPEAGRGTPPAAALAASLDDGTESRPLPLVLPTDLAGVAGIDAATAATLARYVVVLDEPTAVNFNTASAEVIAARVEGMTLSEARELAASRDRAYFTNVGDIRNRMRTHQDAVTDADVAVASRYFLVRGQVRLERAVTRMEALVKRTAPGQPAGPILVLWQREL
jgi:general secretion pathway protein K